MMSGSVSTTWYPASLLRRRDVLGLGLCPDHCTSRHGAPRRSRRRLRAGQGLLRAPVLKPFWHRQQWGRVAWQDAVEDAEGGCALTLEATPGAKQAAFPDGFNPWRGRIGVAVRAAAQDGKANDEVCATVADFFDVPRAAVGLASGATDRRKRVTIDGVTAEQARKCLEGSL